MTFYAIFPDGVMLEVASWDIDNLKRSKAVKIIETPKRNIPKELRQKIILKQESICNHCKNLSSNLHIDHIHPYSQMFTYPNGFDKINEEGNLQALCSTCNLSKKDTWEINTQRTSL